MNDLFIDFMGMSNYARSIILQLATKQRHKTNFAWTYERVWRVYVHIWECVWPGVDWDAHYLLPDTLNINHQLQSVCLDCVGTQRHLHKRIIHTYTTIQKFGMTCHRVLIQYSQRVEQTTLYFLRVFHAFRLKKVLFTTRCY